MLEKMGWSAGRGLGANEDGRVEHVKICHKDDTRGVGCNKSQVDNWITHQDDFNSLLVTLNENHMEGEDNCDDKHKVMNLEKKSKSARSRVHYQKFTKGKDLSSRTSEDLDCIFGRRKKTKSKTVPLKVNFGGDAEDEITAGQDGEPQSYGVQTFDSSHNLQDYFAKKMAEKKGHGNMSDDTANEREVSQSEIKDQETATLGMKTVASSQSVQDYIAQKMANLQESEQVDSPETSTDTDISGVGELSPDQSEASKPDTVVLVQPDQKSKKKRKGDKLIGNDDGEFLTSQAEMGQASPKKKKRKDRKVGKKNLVHSSDIDVPTKSKHRSQRLIDHEHNVSETEHTVTTATKSIVKLGNTKERLGKITLEAICGDAEIETPSKKTVTFREPITSVLGGDSDCSSFSMEELEQGDMDSDGADNKQPSETITHTHYTKLIGKKDLKALGKDLENVVESDRPDCKERKKKSKKKLAVEMPCATEGPEDGADGRRKKKKKEEKNVVLVSYDVISADGDNSENMAVHADGSQTVDESPAKSTVSKVKKKKKKPKKKDIDAAVKLFIGSNIDKIVGYSHRNSVDLSSP